MLTLDIQTGRERGRRVQVGPGGLTLGRGPHNQLVLSDHHLSTEHGQIFREDDRFIYRDLRSTNGSRLRRGGTESVIDGSLRWEVGLCDGDQLLLGDPSEPVLLVCHIEPDPEPEAEAAGDRVLVRRPLADAEAVAGTVERDPQLARTLLLVQKRLVRKGLELGAVLAGIAEAVFELLPLCSHMTIDLAEGPDARMTTVYGAARDGRLEGPIRASRAVVRRVVRERAAVLLANAQMELPEAASIMGARVQSTIGVPLWEGDQLIGVIQCDNRTSSAMFRERDLDLLLVLAGHATLAIENARLLHQLRVAEEQLRGQVRYLKSREEKRRSLEIIGSSPAMREVLRQVSKVTDTRATVCIEGETGTGKELIASLIHYQGRRRDKLFVAQNCAAVPETLLESELFGHKKGAFTGATEDKKGLFEVADGGTLFLDEIAEMSLGLQAKLLRVLQEGEVRPIGSTQPRQVDVRIICATNRSLEQEVQAGRFRQDLYYRLKVFPLRLPPLRERREDVPLLAEHFLRKYAAELKKGVAGFTPETLAQLQAYAWPGNVRELENEVQRLIIQAEPGAFITPDQLSPQIRQVQGLLDRIAPRKGTLKDMMEEVECWLIQKALAEHGGNKTRTAEALGITREGLHKKLAKFGL
ncbi:MAG: sigma 54-interacting transcriptional regulator [Myxococcales bacterium]|nr:sigma 54-interacting transcriptional regulator [Myxococcota bacterium]MDW8283609.1 sigma 54-interacting transcriptional regulator [Myxococcales bacterium]